MYAHIGMIGTPWFPSSSGAGANGMNAVVVDGKDYSGWLTYPSTIPLAAETHATSHAVLASLRRLVHDAHRRGVRVLLRVSCFHDPWMAGHRPDLAIRGMRAWLDPNSQAAQDYLLAVVDETLAAGVDEIQLDYVRYPTEGIRHADFALGAGRRPTSSPASSSACTSTPGRRASRSRSTSSGWSRGSAPSTSRRRGRTSRARRRRRGHLADGVPVALQRGLQRVRRPRRAPRGRRLRHEAGRRRLEAIAVARGRPALDPGVLVACAGLRHELRDARNRPGALRPGGRLARLERERLLLRGHVRGVGEQAGRQGTLDRSARGRRPLNRVSRGSQQDWTVY